MDDLIQRQAVLDAMYELCNTEETLKENPWRDNPHIDAITDAIENLPPVQPEQAKMIKEIREWINSGNRGSADYFIVDKIEEITNKYERRLNKQEGGA